MKTLEDQIQLEENMKKTGAAKFLEMQEENLKKDVAAVPSIVYFTRQIFPGLIQDLKKYIKRSESGRAGINMRNAEKIKQVIKVVKNKEIDESPIDYDRIAYASIVSFFDTIMRSKDSKAAKSFIAAKIGAALEDEVIYSEHKYYHTGIHKLKLNQYKKANSNYKHKRNALIHDVNKKKLHDKWGDEDKIEIGIVMLEFIKNNMGADLEIITDYDNKKTSTYYRLSEEAEQFHKDYLEKIGSYCINKRPSIIKPKDWTSFNSGGYYSWEDPFLRNTSGSETESRNYDILMQVTNIIQDTPWVIDKEMFDLQVELCAFSNDICNSKGKEVWYAFEKQEKPFRPIELDDLDQESDEFKKLLREYKNNVIESIQINNKRRNKFLSQRDALKIASDYFDGELYFPHQPDYRTRNYPQPTIMNTQSADPAKCLIKFKNKKEITPDGLWWLGINTAGLYGEDKVGLDDRVVWCIDNLETILRPVADNPLDNIELWVDADKPFQFVQSAKEYVRAIDAHQAGHTYMGSVPIQADGKCNGLQHYALMMRDETIAPHVGLVPTDIPGDVYQLAADNALELLKESDDPLALAWLAYGIPRKIAKKPVMTFVYGSKRFGISQSIKEELDSLKITPEGDNQQLANFLGQIFTDNMDKVMGKAGAAMLAMRQWVSVYCKYYNTRDKRAPELLWESPLGIIISQREHKSIYKVIKCKLEDSRIQVKTKVDNEKLLDPIKMSNAICPNFVHATDASHMADTILRCYNKGIRDFCMIHDSFGTHASDMDTMIECLKESAIAIHKKDLLKEFRDTIASQLPEKQRAKLLPLPEYGTLDIEELMNSDFFFS